MALMNSRSGAAIASSVELAMTSAERRRGLLGRDSMAPDSAIIITRCNAVHTFWMRFTIDVAFVDSSGTVKKVVEGLVPWRMAGTLFASTVIEWNPFRSPLSGCSRQPGAARSLGFVAASSAVRR